MYWFHVGYTWCQQTTRDNGVTVIWVDRGHQKTKLNKKKRNTKTRNKPKNQKTKRIEGVREIFRTSNEEEREKSSV